MLRFDWRMNNGMWHTGGRDLPQSEALSMFLNQFVGVFTMEVHAITSTAVVLKTYIPFIKRLEIWTFSGSEEEMRPFLLFVYYIYTLSKKMLSDDDAAKFLYDNREVFQPFKKDEKIQANIARILTLPHDMNVIFGTILGIRDDKASAINLKDLCDLFVMHMAMDTPLEEIHLLV